MPGNGTEQVAVPAQALVTSDIGPICMQKMVFDISGCPNKGCTSNSQASLVQVSRGLPALELEYQMFKTTSPTNATGTVCTANGELMTCTNLCVGDLCNDMDFSPNLLSYTETLTTDCIKCNAVQDDTDFNECLMGSNYTTTQTCASNVNSAGNWYLPNMCVSIVNYANATMEPVSIYRGCGIPDFAIFPTKGVQFSTLGQCNTDTEIVVDGKSTPTISCVKGYIQDVDMNGEQYIANFNRAAPSPNNASCWQCNAMMGDMAFEGCLNPNGTNLESTGVSQNVCELGVTECSTVFYYNGTEPGAVPVMVQRSCGAVDTRTMNTTGCQDNDEWMVVSDTCSATVDPQAQNTTMPCNSATAAPIPTLNCYTCKASEDQPDFEACMNPNATESSSNSTMISSCACGTNMCMVATMYNSNGTVVGVQRGCGSVAGTTSQDVCSFTDASDVDTSNVLCTSSCPAGDMPCNNYNNPYTPGNTPINSGFMLSFSVVLALLGLFM